MKIIHTIKYPIVEENVDEFLLALVIGQKIINAKRNYVDCFQIEIRT